jgi:hypothetical protein
MGKFLNQIRAKLGLDPKRDVTVTGKVPNEVVVNRATQNEAFAPDRPVVLAPARMNPPTAGHGVLVRQVMNTAREYGAPHHIVLTRSHDKPTARKSGAAVRNPLSPEQKVTHARRFFPGANISVAHPERPNLLSQASELHGQGHNHLIIVAGSDRVPEYEKLLNQYNGKEGKHGYYNFKKITVVPAGEERDSKAEGVAGWSGTAARKAVEGGDVSRMRQIGVPGHVSDEHFNQYVQHLKTGMGLNEASEGYPVPTIPTRNARDFLGKKSPLNNLPPPDKKGDIGLDTDLEKGDKTNFELMRRRTKKRLVQVGFLEGYDVVTDGSNGDNDVAAPGTKPTGSFAPNAPTSAIPSQPLRKTKNSHLKTEGMFGDPTSDATSMHGATDLDYSSKDPVTLTTSKYAKKNFKSVREVFELVRDRTNAANKQRFAKRRYERTGILPGSKTSIKDAEAEFFARGGKVKKYDSRGNPIEEELLHERGEDKKGYYRSTESGAGLTRKGAKAMGIKTAVTTPPSKLDPNGKAAKRRKSFCARMGGMKGPMKDEKGRPTRKAMSLRRWNCEEAELSEKVDVTIKKKTSDEANVSKRHISYDVYHNGKYHTTFNDINDALDHKDKMQKEEAEPISELSTDTINAARREIEKRASNPRLDPKTKERRLKSFATGTNKILGLARVNATEELDLRDEDDDTTQAGAYKRGTRVRIKKDGYKGKGNVDLYDPTSNKYIVSIDKNGSNLHLGADEIEPISESLVEEVKSIMYEVFQNDIAKENKLGSASLGKPLKSGHKLIGTLPNGHEVHHRKAGTQNQYRVVDPKTRRVNTVLTTKPHKGGAEEIDTLAGNHESGGAHHLYQHLILKHDKVLSSNNQSAGARRVWAKASSHRSIGTHGYDPKTNTAFHARPDEDEHYSSDDDYDKAVSDRASSKRDKRKHDKEIRDIMANDDKYIVMHKKVK